jgi:hypothetical protein
VATQVASAQTSTAVQGYFQTATEAARAPPVANPTALSPTWTATPTRVDLKAELGMPVFRDELNNGARWNLTKPNTDTPNVTVKVENGGLLMTRSVPFGGKNWWLNYQTIQDFYLDARISTRNCSSDDQYGLIFRAPNYSSGFGFYFTITCDGYFNLMRWDDNGAYNLFKWELADAIQAGSNKTNVFAILAIGDFIRLYANQQLLKEISDSALRGKGHFGLFIDSRQTPDFTIEMQEIAYWENPPA